MDRELFDEIKRAAYDEKVREMSDETVNLDKQNAGPDEAAPEGYDWLGRPKDPRIESLRRMSVNDCPECDGGRMVRYCSIHGLKGTAPR